MTTTISRRHQEFLDEYRSLPAGQRYLVAARATPDQRRKLMAIERNTAMDRSPGAMVSVLTEGRELQAPHLNLIDQAFQRIDAGEKLQVMLTMPPRHGKSQRASRWGPLWYLRRHPEHRVVIAFNGLTSPKGTDGGSETAARVPHGTRHPPGSHHVASDVKGTFRADTRAGLA
ncbi:hypothetical protein [Streptomyces sp. NPDC002215]|uniref:hypothetical protein n=1 Tax=Streptomyces sp. NPDC002215 TaxID=3154412 RepID=UPI00332DAE6C